MRGALVTIQCSTKQVNAGSDLVRCRLHWDFACSFQARVAAALEENRSISPGPANQALALVKDEAQSSESAHGDLVSTASLYSNALTSTET